MLRFLVPAGATCTDGKTFSPTDPNLPGSPNGTWQIEVNGGLHRWRIIGCPAGYIPYRDDSYPDQDHCIACIANTYLLLPSTVRSNSSCLPCPVGGICDGIDVVRAQEEYWRKYDDKFNNRRALDSLTNLNGSATILRAEIFRCPPGACVGDNVCANNATGPVCGVCPPGWAFTSRGCFQCPSEEVIAPIRNVTIALAALVFCLIWYHISWRFLYPRVPVIHWISEKLMKIATTCIGTGGDVSNASKAINSAGVKMRGFYIFISKLKFTQYLKIFISYFQVLGSFVVLHVKWPQLMVSMMVWFKGTFNFAILELPGVSCLWAGISFKAKLLVYTLLPISVGILLYLPLVVVKFRVLMWKLDPCNRTSDLFWNNILFLAFLVYPITSLVTLQSFNCEPLGLGLLAADYRERCPDSNSFLRIYSIPFIIVYPIGIPVVMYLVLRNLRVQEIASRKVSGGIISAMIAFFVKQTSSVESQRLAQMIGRSSNKEEFEKRCRSLYQQLFSANSTRYESVPRGETEFNQIEITLWSRNKPRSCLLMSHDVDHQPVSSCSESEGGWNVRFNLLFPSNDAIDKVGGVVVSLDTEDVEVIKIQFSPEELQDVVTNVKVLSKGGKYDSRDVRNIDFGDEHSESKEHLDFFVTLKAELGKARIRKSIEIQAQDVHSIGLEGTTVHRLKELFLRFDKDKDDHIDEEEFLRLATDISEISHLFTGAESGEDLLQSLSKEQIRSLLTHSWPTQEEAVDDNDAGALLETAFKIQRISSSDVDQDTKKELEKRQEYLEQLSLEELREKLLAVGMRLRSDGIISLPTITWNFDARRGSEDPENLAIRKAGFLFLAYKVDYWYWEMLEMFRR